MPREEEEGGLPPPPPTFWEKCGGVANASRPPPVGASAIAVSGATSFVGIGCLSLVHFGVCDTHDATMILGSMGATAALVFGAPAAPFSQPRNVVGGHLLACAIGVGAVHVGLPLPLAAPVAVSASIMAMQATGTLHPPASGTALIAVLGSAQVHALGFGLLFPTALGSSALVAVALLNNAQASGKQYPQYWW